MDSKMKKAGDLSIPVVDLSFLDAIKGDGSDETFASLITKKNIVISNKKFSNKTSQLTVRH